MDLRVRLLIASVNETQALVNNIQYFLQARLQQANPTHRGLINNILTYKNRILDFKTNVFQIDEAGFNHNKLLSMIIGNNQLEHSVFNFDNLQREINNFSEYVTFKRYAFQHLIPGHSSPILDRYYENRNEINQQTRKEVCEPINTMSTQTTGEASENSTDSVSEVAISDKVVIDPNITRVEYTHRIGNVIENSNSSLYTVLCISAEKQSHMPVKKFIGAEVHVNFNAPFHTNFINSIPIQSLTLVRNKVQVRGITLDYGGQYVNRLGIGYRPFYSHKDTFISANYPLSKSNLNIKHIGLEASVGTGSLFQVKSVNFGGKLKVHCIKAEPVFLQRVYKFHEIVNKTFESTDNLNACEPLPLASLSMRYPHFGKGFDKCFRPTFKLNPRDSNQHNVVTCSVDSSPVCNFVKPDKSTTGTALFSVGFLVAGFICSKIFQKFRNTK